MKKTKLIEFAVFLTVMSSCAKTEKDQQKKMLHVRTDSTAQYSSVNTHSSGGHYSYIRFYSWGTYSDGVYHRVGSHSENISSKSNVFTTRGGFGRSGYSVSS